VPSRSSSANRIAAKECVAAPGQQSGQANCANAAPVTAASPWGPAAALHIDSPCAYCDWWQFGLEHPPRLAASERDPLPSPSRTAPCTSLALLTKANSFARRFTAPGENLACRLVGSLTMRLRPCLCLTVRKSFANRGVLLYLLCPGCDRCLSVPFLVSATSIDYSA